MISQLSDSQIRQFNEDGFLVVENLVSQELVSRLHTCFEQLFRGEFETGITPDEVNWQQETGDPSLTRQICNGWKANRTIASVVTRSDIGESIAILGNWPGTRLMIDNVVWKPPRTRSILYHQDNAYLKWYTPSELLSCWIALDDTNASGGTIEYVRGSHKWQHAPPEGEFHGPEDYRAYMEQAARREGIKPEIYYVEVPKGGGTFHHGWTWHGSGENKTSRPRRSLVLHGMRSDARYDPANLSQGTGTIYSRYKHLDDDRLDEKFFPVIWRNDGYRTPGIDRFVGGSGPQ